MFMKHGKIKKQKDNDLAKQLRLSKPKTQKPANSFSKQWLATIIPTYHGPNKFSAVLQANYIINSN